MIVYKEKGHIVSHGDVLQIDPKDYAPNQVDVMYSDPPWGVGNLRYWQTLNKRHTGQEKTDQDLNKFLERIFQIAANYVKPEGLIFLEYGVRWKDFFIAYAAEFGLHHLSTLEMQYRSGSRFLPADLHIFCLNGTIKIPDSYINAVEGKHGYDWVISALRPFLTKDSVVLDPCCGMGYVAQAAIDCGAKFRGNELNSKRLEKTINRLKKS